VKCRPAFKQTRTWQRASSLVMSQLLCMGRHTVTGLLCTAGRQFHDWSADYRLFSKCRFDQGALFGVIRKGVLDEISPHQPLVVAIDDSIMRKTGRRTPGVAWRRDPLGPPFHVNFINAQRILQISAAVPKNPPGPGPARMIPVDFIHAPTPKRPRKTAAPSLWEEYRQKKREHNISLKGAHRLQHLRNELDNNDNQSQRPLWALADGRFANRNFLKNLPERTTAIVRARADAKLYHPPAPKPTRSAGRKRLYGEREKTPEEILKDQSIPYQRVEAFAAGKLHQFKVKTLAPLLWRTAGAQTPLRLIVIAPLGYRLRKKGRLLYRKPAYLLCTDPALSLEQIIQAYVWRWDIEVNFRDEKQLVGVGEAQVRSKASVQNAPALAVAAYAMLLLAAHQAFGYDTVPHVIPPPKWRTASPKPRASTLDLIRHLRAELWGAALDKHNCNGFMNSMTEDLKPEKFKPQLHSAVLYAA